MNSIRPIFKKLLIIALVIYVIGACVIQADLYRRIGKAEHTLVHILGSHSHHD